MKKGILAAAIVLLLIISYLLVRKPISANLNTQGLAAFDSAAYPRAEELFRRALRWKYHSAEIATNLVKSQLAQDSLKRAANTLEKLLKLAPNSAETQALQGQLLVMNKEYQQALPLLTGALSQDSLLAYAYFYRGIAYANLDSLEQAASDYLKAQQLNSTNRKALYEGAAIYGKLENFDAAIASYNKILALEPSNATAYYERGNFKLRILDYSGADSDFTTALQLRPNLYEAHYALGKSYAFQEKYPDAIQHFEASLSGKYKIPESHYNIGLASLKLNQLKQANQHLKLCTSIIPNNLYLGKAYFMLGVVEMMQNNNPSSIPYFTQAISCDSLYTEAYFNRGIANGMLEHYADAIADMNRCLALGKKTSEVYFALGVYKISQTHYTEGCEALSIAAQMGDQKALAMQKQYCR